jgi:hypothetical protein
VGHRESRRWIVHATAFFDLRRGTTQVTETPDKETQGQPEAAQQQPEAAQPGVSRRTPVILISIAALAVIGAATANALPNLNGFALPDFNRLSLPNFNGFSWPDFSRFTAPPPHETVTVSVPIPVPDPAVSAALKDIRKDIQSSQQQNTAVLVSLAQSSATQQADLKRVSRQLAALAVQVDGLQSTVRDVITPLTTSSIPHSNPHTRVVRPSRKTEPALPPAVGPVSVGGAPLSSSPGPRSGV